MHNAKIGEHPSYIAKGKKMPEPFIEIQDLSKVYRTAAGDFQALDGVNIRFDGAGRGVGLSGTLSINVMERTQEIGILRSMGANVARRAGQVTIREAIAYE